MTSAPSLDRTFHALANPTRRAVVERLAVGAAAVSEVAQAFDMALPSFLQHVRVLESSGLVASEKHGRVRTLQLCPAQLRTAAAWLAEPRELWETRLAPLDEYATRLARETRDD